MPDWPYRRKNRDVPSLLPPTQSQMRGWLGLLRLSSGRVGEGEDIIYLSVCVTRLARRCDLGHCSKC